MGLCAQPGQRRNRLPAVIQGYEEGVRKWSLPVCCDGVPEVTLLRGELRSRHVSRRVTGRLQTARPVATSRTGSILEGAVSGLVEVKIVRGGRSLDMKSAAAPSMVETCGLLRAVHWLRLETKKVLHLFRDFVERVKPGTPGQLSY